MDERLPPAAIAAVVRGGLVVRGRGLERPRKARAMASSGPFTVLVVLVLVAVSCGSPPHAETTAAGSTNAEASEVTALGGSLPDVIPELRDASPVLDGGVQCPGPSDSETMVSIDWDFAEVRRSLDSRPDSALGGVEAYLDHRVELDQRTSEPTIDLHRVAGIKPFLEPAPTDSPGRPVVVLPWVQGEVDGARLAEFRLSRVETAYVVETAIWCESIFATPQPRVPDRPEPEQTQVDLDRVTEQIDADLEAERSNG